MAPVDDHHHNQEEEDAEEETKRSIQMIYLDLCVNWRVLQLPFFFLLSFTVLLIALSKPAINEVFLVLVSYAIIFTFFLIQVCLALTNYPR